MWYGDRKLLEKQLIDPTQSLTDCKGIGYIPYSVLANIVEIISLKCTLTWQHASYPDFLNQM